MSSYKLISGLGADRRAFSRLGSFTSRDMDYVDWIRCNDNDSLHTYCLRLIDKYSIEPSDILVGLSFGGMVAIEIARILGTKHVILISSLRDRADVKTFYATLLKLRLYRLIPNVRVAFMYPFIRIFLNVSSEEGQRIMDSMIQNHDLRFTKWAFARIAESKFEGITGTTIYNIIGTRDNLIKPWTNENTVAIESAGHFMIFENHIRITEALRRFDTQINNSG